jgi:hypothetical protein
MKNVRIFMKVTTNFMKNARDLIKIVADLMKNVRIFMKVTTNFMKNVTDLMKITTDLIKVIRIPLKILGNLMRNVRGVFTKLCQVKKYIFALLNETDLSSAGKQLKKG